MQTTLTKTSAGSVAGVTCFALMLLAGSTGSAAAPPAACAEPPKASQHYQIPADAETVHWGYFSKNRKPVLAVHSGDLVTIETLTHHANDDAERMVKGDPALRASLVGPRTRRTSTAAAPDRWTPRSMAAVPAKASASTS